MCRSADDPAPGCAPATVALIAVRGDLSVAYTAPYENLTIGSLASQVSSLGGSVRMVDEMLDPGGRDACLRAARGARHVVVDGTFRTMTDALALLRTLRNDPAAPRTIVIGGAGRSGARALLEEHPEVDAVVGGEPWETLPVLLGRSDWSTGVPGAVVRGRAGTVALPSDPLPSGPWRMPWPDRRYLAEALRGRPVADVLTSRGCSAACSFCMVGAGYAGADGSLPGHRWQAREADDVAAEVADLVDRFGVRRVHFADDNFVGSRRSGGARAAQLAERLRPLDVRFSFYCRKYSEVL